MSKNLSKTHIILISLVVALLVGFVSGIAGDIVSRYYLRNISLFNDLYLPQQGQVGERQIIIQEANRVIVEQDGRVGQVIDSTAKASLGIYRAKNLGTNPIDQVYAPHEVLSHAVSLTSDGWVLAYAPQSYTAASIVVVKGAKVYPVERVVHDDQTGLTFLKVTATDLPVIGFAPLENIMLGQTVIAYDVVRDAVTATQISDLDDRLVDSRFDVVQSIEGYNQRMQLSDEVEGRGVPVVNLDGRLVGVTAGGADVVKATYINFLLKSVLKDGVLTKPYVGIRYMPLHEMPGFVTALEGGAVISRSATQPAVSANSPLAGQVQEGDIIVSVEGNRLTRSAGFADVLFDYKLGDMVTLTVVRGDQQFDIEYELKAQ